MAKQAIIIRKDLNLAGDELAVFVAHASTKALLALNKSKDRFKLEMDLDPYVVGWLEGKAEKEIVWVDSKEELDEVLHRAQSIKRMPVTTLKSLLEEDNPELLCVVVGPSANGKVDNVKRSR